MISTFGGVNCAMFVSTRITPITSLLLNIQFLTDDKREKKQGSNDGCNPPLQGHCRNSFHIVDLGSDLGRCTFNFGHHQARALRLFKLVKRQVSKNQRMTSSVQTGVGS